ncbi:MAG: tRNA (N(6)-L-threonylcarbamoyladenosine(37)-C(2))-methylthiotransferase, partial [Candidatus Micrarchaeaceae archaeon]
LNQADSNIISSVLKRSNIAVAGSEADADVVIVNTCTVKKATAQRILYKLNNLDRSGKRLVVTGCMAGANPDLIGKYAPNASIVTAPNIEYIDSVVSGSGRIVLNKYKKIDRLALLEPENSVIAKIPINDGCTSSCSFCETKFARGALNSFSEQLILKSIEQSVRMGAREVQLTSQDIGAYGLDRGTNIAELMGKISLIEGDFKVRIGMLNPEHIHRYFDKFVDALKDDRFYSFVHLPVQSGSNRVLKDMRRSYTVERFEHYVSILRAAIPGITIETDIIVGFPTETGEDFEKTLDFIKRVKPEVTNVSRFGARPHASASKLEQHTDMTIKNRSNKLSRVVRSVQHEINDRFIGKTLDAIITEMNGKSFNGRSASYKQIVMPRTDGSEVQIGSIHSVLINAASANVLYT